MSVGSSTVADFANTYPGSALGVQANASDGWGNSVGGSSVIAQFGVTPTDYFVQLENASGNIAMETTGSILLEIS